MRLKPLTIFIPEPRSSFFSLYAHCSLSHKSYVGEKRGSFLKTRGGVAILFYTSAHHHRRAYIVCPYQDQCFPYNLPPSRLKSVSETLAILYCAQGRKVDFLKRSLWYIQRETGSPHMFSLPLAFWMRFSALNDMYHPRYKLPGSTYSNISQLLLRYKGAFS